MKSVKSSITKYSNSLDSVNLDGLVLTEVSNYVWVGVLLDVATALGLMRAMIYNQIMKK